MLLTDTNPTTLDEPLLPRDYVVTAHDGDVTIQMLIAPGEWRNVEGSPITDGQCRRMTIPGLPLRVTASTNDTYFLIEAILR